MCRGRPGVVSVRGIFSDSGRIGPVFRVEMLVTWAFGGWPGFGLPGRRASDRIFSEGFLPGHNLTAGRRAFSTGLAKPAKVDRHRPPCRLWAEMRLRAVASVSEPKSAGDQGAPVPAISRRASSAPVAPVAPVGRGGVGSGFRLGPPMLRIEIGQRESNGRQVGSDLLPDDRFAFDAPGSVRIVFVDRLDLLLRIAGHAAGQTLQRFVVQTADRDGGCFADGGFGFRPCGRIGGCGHGGSCRGVRGFGRSGRNRTCMITGRMAKTGCGFRRTSPRGKSEKPHKRAAEASFREVTAARCVASTQFAPSYGNRRDPSSFGFGARACPGAAAGLPECSVKRPVSVSGCGEVRIFAREIGSVRSS